MSTETESAETESVTTVRATTMGTMIERSRP